MSTITLYDKNFVVARSDTGAAGAKGLYFDGCYYWTLGAGGSGLIYQLYWDGSQYSIVQSITPDFEFASGHSLAELQAISGDGVNLFILIKENVRFGMAFTQIWNLYLMGKDGKTKSRSTLSINALLSDMYDITFDGKHLSFSWQTNSPRPTHRWRFEDVAPLNNTRQYTLSAGATAELPAGRFTCQSFDGVGYDTAKVQNALNITHEPNKPNGPVVALGVTEDAFSHQNGDGDFEEFFSLGAFQSGPYIAALR